MCCRVSTLGIFLGVWNCVSTVRMSFWRWSCDLCLMDVSQFVMYVLCVPVNWWMDFVVRDWCPFYCHLFRCRKLVRTSTTLLPAQATSAAPPTTR